MAAEDFGQGLCTTSTGKQVDLDQVRFDLLSKDKSKGDYHIIFMDYSEVYLTVAEYREVHDFEQARSKRWREKNATKG